MLSGKGAKRVRRSRRRWPFWLAVLLVVAGLSAAAFVLLRPKPPEDPLASLGLVAVTRGNLENVILTQGTVEPGVLQTATTLTDGRIKTVSVQVGQEVVAGDLIAEIDPSEKEQAVRDAEIALAAGKAKLDLQVAARDNAKKALERTERLAGRNILTEHDLDLARSEVLNAITRVADQEQVVRDAEKYLASLRVALSRTRIVAPVSGTVVAVLLQPGQLVASETWVARIANIETMKVRTLIAEADIPNIQPGFAVHFNVVGEPGRRYDATISSIDPAPRSIASSPGVPSSLYETIYYDALIEVPNPDHALRISLTAEVSIVLNAAQDALVIPSTALIQNDDGTTQVYVMGEPGVLELRTVTSGVNDGAMVEITDGLSEGEMVVSVGGLGIPIEILEGAAKGTVTLVHGKPPPGAVGS